jgi:hypothetical protein
MSGSAPEVGPRYKIPLEYGLAAAFVGILFVIGTATQIPAIVDALDLFE